MDLKAWKVEAVLDATTAADFARLLENAMNRLEENGYDVQEPKPIGRHYIVYGRQRTKAKRRSSGQRLE